MGKPLEGDSLFSADAQWFSTLYLCFLGCLEERTVCLFRNTNVRGQFLKFWLVLISLKQFWRLLRFSGIWQFYEECWREGVFFECDFEPWPVSWREVFIVIGFAVVTGKYKFCAKFRFWLSEKVTGNGYFRVFLRDERLQGWLGTHGTGHLLTLERTRAVYIAVSWWPLWIRMIIIVVYL